MKTPTQIRIKREFEDFKLVVADFIKQREDNKTHTVNEPITISDDCFDKLVNEKRYETQWIRDRESDTRREIEERRR